MVDLSAFRYVSPTKITGTTWNALLDVLETLDVAAPGEAPNPATGDFFDSAAGDLFTDLSYPASAALTVSATEMVFSSPTPVALDVKVKRGDSTPLDFAFDAFTVDATFTITSFPAVDVTGAYVGTLNDVIPLYAGELKAHPGAATTMFARLWNNGSPVENDVGGFAFSPGDIVRSRYVKNGTTAQHIVNYPATSSHTMTITQVFDANSYELPRMFSAPAIRFAQGAMTLTALKVSASYANARFAFIGDSLTQGRIATAYADAFAQKVRADHANDVIVCGAPSATTSDWTGAVQDVVLMNPTNAFVMLGTNDITLGRSLASIQADYTSIITELQTAGINPVVITVPPNGDADTATFNTWLKSQGWGYVDVYPDLLGVGVALGASYDSGDGIHLNTAGHDVVYDALTAYIAAEGL